jgi:hypothetical protein
MVSKDQYLNRLIEWFPTHRLDEAVIVFHDIVDHGISPDDAFDMVINL